DSPSGGARSSCSPAGRGCGLRAVFFFQAEDGIRDFHVTGVQTCALPISLELHIKKIETEIEKNVELDEQLKSQSKLIRSVPGVRSEERRVGKERRCRGWPAQ